MEISPSPYVVGVTLRTPEEMLAYLEVCLEEADGDVAFIAKALGDIARAQGMTKVARDSGQPLRRSRASTITGGDGGLPGQRCNEERSGINATSGCLATLEVAPAHEMG
jgi:hypothetical protein